MDPHDAHSHALLLDYIWEWPTVVLPNSAVSGITLEAMIGWSMRPAMREWLNEHAGPRHVKTIDENTNWFWYRKKPKRTFCTFYFRDPKIATYFKLVWG
jgi:hypothetical protein